MRLFDKIKILATAFINEKLHDPYTYIPKL